MDLSRTPTVVEEVGQDRSMSKKAGYPTQGGLSASSSRTVLNHSDVRDEEKGSTQRFAGEGTAASPFVVGWDGLTDVEDPHNFTSLRKGLSVAVLAISTLAVSFASSIYGGGAAQIGREFGVGSEVVTLGLSLFVLGFALGPLLWAPLSEVLGRRPVHIFAFGLFWIFHLPVGAARNIETIIVCRFLGGFAGASVLNNAGGTIGDMYTARTRATAMGFYASAPFLGPVLGPVIGGFLGETESWRWIFWLLAIFSFVVWVAGVFIPETYAPVLLRRRAERLSRETGSIHVSEFDAKADASETFSHKMMVNFTRPFYFLFTEMIALCFALYAAFIYGVLYLSFGAVPIVYQAGRGWSPGIGGLPFIGMGVGMMIAVVINLVNSARYARAVDAAGGSLPPEARLPVACFGGVCIPISLFIFTFTIDPSIHWIGSVIALVPFGIGIVLVFVSMMSYLVDCYLFFAASALASNAVLRALFATGFPLFTVQMFHGMGSKWALLLLSCVALLLTPIPFVFYFYGPRIRANSKFAPGHPSSAAPAVRQNDLAEREELELVRANSRRPPTS